MRRGGAWFKILSQLRFFLQLAIKQKVATRIKIGVINFIFKIIIDKDTELSRLW
ncbi:hypothetical protein D3C78_1699960 [compost metagenome]